MEKIKCEHCGEAFKTQPDLDAHQFNNRHCPPVNKVKCPECLSMVGKDELKMFGGICEECATNE